MNARSINKNFETIYQMLSLLRISFVIIQQIVTLSKYGHDALDICHTWVKDVRRYT